MNNVLVDTNLLIYAVDENSKYFELARRLLSKNSYHLLTTSKNISEFIAVVTKGSPPFLSIDKALELVRDYLKIFEILYPSPQSFSLFQKMLKNYKPSGLRVHDFEIISIGLANSVSLIATLDSKDFLRVKEIELLPIRN